MKNKLFNFSFLLFIFVGIFLLNINVFAKNEKNYVDALSHLQSPIEEMLETGICNLRINDSLFVPFIEDKIIPTDENEKYLPVINGNVYSSNESIISINSKGLMTAHNNGKCEIIYQTGGEEKKLNIIVDDKNIPLGIRNMVYIAKQEFYSTEMSRLPKYNKYAQWYYKKHKEVGWCSVFASYCVNAAGITSYKYNTIPVNEINDYSVFGLLEGQVGHQWDGYISVDRFTNVPKLGYFVIYGNRKNAYKFTHIGMVVDAVDLGDGVYKVTTIEGNMSNTVKSYCYEYDSKTEHPKANMSILPVDLRDDPFPQYELHTDYWDVFGFCATWK